MGSNWYYAENDRQKGPVSSDELKALLNSGTLPAETLVWHSGLPQWRPAAEFPELRESANPDSVKSVPENVAGGQGLSSSPKTFFSQWCSGELPSGMSREYAGIGRRFWAMLLDAVILMIFAIPLSLLWVILNAFVQLVLSKDGLSDPSGFSAVLSISSFFGNFLVTLLLQFVYSGFFLSRYSATPGKMVLGILVVRSDGSRVSFLRGGSRVMAEMISAWFFFVGYLIAFFDEQRRTLHDHLCDTRVILRQ